LWTDTYIIGTKQNSWYTAECHKLSKTEYFIFGYEPIPK